MESHTNRSSFLHSGLALPPAHTNPSTPVAVTSRLTHSDPSCPSIPPSRANCAKRSHANTDAVRSSVACWTVRTGPPRGVGTFALRSVAAPMRGLSAARGMGRKALRMDESPGKVKRERDKRREGMTLSEKMGRMDVVFGQGKGELGSDE